MTTPRHDEMVRRVMLAEQGSRFGFRKAVVAALELDPTIGSYTDDLGEISRHSKTDVRTIPDVYRIDFTKYIVNIWEIEHQNRIDMKSPKWAHWSNLFWFLDRYEWLLGLSIVDYRNGSRMEIEPTSFAYSMEFFDWDKVMSTTCSCYTKAPPGEG